MNVSRRRYMGEKGGSSPYQRIEYLESTGTQYIDTGFKAAGNLSIKIKAVDYLNSNHKGKYLFGGRDGYQNKMFGLYIDANNSQVTFSYNNLFPGCGSYTLFPASALVEIGSGKVYIGGTLRANYSVASFTSSKNVLLFGLQNGSDTLIFQCKIGDTYISNGTVTRDFIPVRIGQVGYMYDRVSGELFGNAGTGDFVLGPDIN